MSVSNAEYKPDKKALQQFTGTAESTGRYVTNCAAWLAREQ
jgi:hypothetical protein